MNIKKLIMLWVAAMAISASALDYVEVIDVSARQRYPWNGLVDIDFELDSKATEPYLMNVTVFDNVGKTNLPVKTVCTEGISFDGNPCMVHKDSSRIVWNASADLPEGFKCTNVLVTCRDIRAGAVSNLYMVVDISEGASSSSFNVTYTNSAPEGGWSEEFKTGKIVLRRVEPQVFLMGSPLSEGSRASNETQHRVSLTSPYYISVFELTASQFAKVYGGTGTDTQPVKKTWDVVRGWDVVNTVTTKLSDPTVSPYDGVFTVTQSKTATSYAWPNGTDVDPDSFMGKLRAKTGMKFDLPTEAQWECACRAGTLTPVNIGEENSSASTALISGGAKLDPTGSHYVYVGNYMPNALGLYDMSGGVDEWCLDVYKADLGSGSVENPVGAALAYETKQLMNRTFVYSEPGPWTISFGGKTLSCPSGWKYGCYVSYTAYGVSRVVRGGGARSAARGSSLNVNSSGAIFTSGVRGKKASYSNAAHGIRIAITVND